MRCLLLAFASHRPLIHSPICSIVASAVAHARRDPALGDHDQAVADLEQLVELLADDQHARSRCRAAPAARRGSAPRRRRRRPRSAARRSAASGSASISRPTMNFCRLPPDRLFAADAGPPALTLKRRISASASASTSPMRIQPPRPTARGARQQRVLRQRQRRHRAAAEPLLGHEVQAAAAAAARRVAARCRWPNRRIEPVRRAHVLARERAPSAPAGRCPRRRRCRRSRRRAPRSEIAVEAGAERVFLGQRERRAPSSTTAPARASRCCSCGGSAPIIRRDRLALVSLRRVDLAGDLAAAQHRAVVAERADLVELVLM